MTRKHLRNLLNIIELERSVKVIMAVESGSRQWGFAAADSDYDVRFIYRRHPDAVLSLWPYRDTIERTQARNGEIIDAVGWDLKKALCLMVKGNVQPAEWLTYSPIVAEQDHVALLQTVLNSVLSPRSMFLHYRGIAYSNWTKYIWANDQVRQKRYLYVVRGIVNAYYARRFASVPPADTVDAIDALRDVGAALPEPFTVEALGLIMKKRDSELADGPRIEAIDKEMWALQNDPDLPPKGTEPNRVEIDSIYRKIIRA
jgi:predicted nucleotidyltransferase